jgi:hypothetical protein
MKEPLHIENIQTEFNCPFFNTVHSFDSVDKENSVCFDQEIYIDESIINQNLKSRNL